jgi:hypothetical protein
MNNGADTPLLQRRSGAPAPGTYSAPPASLGGAMRASARTSWASLVRTPQTSPGGTVRRSAFFAGW